MRREGTHRFRVHGPKGGVVWLRNWRRRVFDPALHAAGLGELTPHELRHAAASLAVAAGANVKAVQRMLGHASAAMTLDVYSGLFDDDLDAVADRLDAAARAARGLAATPLPIDGQLIILPNHTDPRRPSRSHQMPGADARWLGQ